MVPQRGKAAEETGVVVVGVGAGTGDGLGGRRLVGRLTLEVGIMMMVVVLCWEEAGVLV